jgi:RHS repeat-associated protein
MTPPGGSAVSMSYADTDQTERVSAGPHTYESTQLGLDSDTVRSTTTRFTRDPGGIPIDERTSSATYYYLLDAQGSIVGLSDSSGGAIAGGTFTYDPFGAVTSSNTGAAASNPLRYTGGFADAHSGGPFSGNFGYTKLGTRYLESGLQRWTQVDPVTGQIGHPVTRNGYLYVQDNPANMTDSTGRFSPCTSSWLDVGLDAWGFISSGVAFAASFGLASPPLFIESLAFFAWNTANFELDVQEVEANC